MRKPNKREYFWLVVLAAAVVYTVSLDANLREKRRQNQTLRAGARGQAKQPASPGSASTRPRPRQSSRAVGAGVLEEFDQWSDDPFDREFTRLVEAETEGDGGHGVQLPELQGVLVMDRRAAAMINGDVYEVGDRMLHYVVESIAPDRVVLRNVLDGSTLRLEVD